MTRDDKRETGSWGDFALFLLKLGGYLVGLFAVGLAMFWARRHLGGH